MKKAPTKAEGKKLCTWIREADKVYEAWENKYRVQALCSYYEGFHYEDQQDEYLVNMFWGTIERKLPGMIFQNPRFRISPKPSELLVDSEEAYRVTTNLDDSLHDWVSEASNNFSTEAEQAALDAFFGFGVLEIGYSASYSINPHLSKPVIPNDYTDDVSDAGKKGKVETLSVEDENVYVKQIPFEQFRVSANHHRFLEQCDWYGYYEFFRVDDLLSDPNLVNKQFLGSGSYTSTEVGLGLAESYGKDTLDFTKSSKDFEKVWKIWDPRTKHFRMIVESSQTIIYKKKYTVPQIKILQFRRPRKGFYPVPYTFNWLPQQRELNETRESQRVHRRKFKRLYQVKSGTVELDDFKATLNGPDGGVIIVNDLQGILPIPIAELGASDAVMAQVSKEDFNVVSGTSAEILGQSDRITATQANITNVRASVRESRERAVVANFLVDTAKTILMIMREYFVNPRVVSSAPNDPMGSEISVMQTAREIDPVSDFGKENFDFNVTIAVETLSPEQNEEESKKFLSFMSLLKQFPEFAANPNIIREMAHYSGYKNERIIRELQQMATMTMVAQAAMGTAQQQQGGNLAQQTVESATPPNTQEIENQLREQGLPMTR